MSGRILSLAAAAWLVLAALVAPTICRAQSQETLRQYDEGTRLIEQGDYAGAFDAYRAVLDQGVASEALYYNLGIAFYRLDRLGDAIRYFEKAALLDPGDRLVRHNLDIARSRLTDRITRLPTPFWLRIGQGVVRAFGVYGLFTIGLAGWFTLATCIVLGIRRGSVESWIRRGAVAGAIIAVVFLGAAFLSSAVSPFGNRSVVVEEAVPLTSSAGGTDRLQELHEGTVVDILEVQGSWARVRLANGVTGWLEAAGLAGI